MYMSKIKAFTLVELVISILIISIAITGSLLSFKIAGMYSADPMIMHQGISIAKSYLEEIMSKEFPTAYPCSSPPVAGRSEYASVCDYDGLTDVGARDQMNQALTGLEGYTVNVNIDGTTAVLGTLTSGTEVVRVDVTVTHNVMPMVKLSGYRTSY